jgi:hypothetical protein
VEKLGSEGKWEKTEIRGMAKCMKGDVFSKEEGRRFALEAALAGKLDRGTRRNAWEAYFKRKGAVG